MFIAASLVRGPAESSVWRMSEQPFTDRQGQYLAFIDAYTRVHGRPPAETDMQRHFRVSPPSVRQSALRASDGAHAGAPRPGPPPARGGAQHRGAPRPRRPARLTPSRTRQILCAEELVVQVCLDQDRFAVEHGRMPGLGRKVEDAPRPERVRSLFRLKDTRT